MGVSQASSDWVAPRRDWPTHVPDRFSVSFAPAPLMATTSLYSELEEVLRAGTHQLVFIDDGGAGHHSMDPDILVQDHLSFTAVIVPARSFIPLNDAFVAWLSEVHKDVPSVTELHATALINPKRNQPWRDIEDMEVRAGHLQRAADALLPHVKTVIHAHIGREQYESLLAARAEQVDGLYDHVKKDLSKHKHGLELVTLNVVAARLQKRGVPSVVFEDEGRYRLKNEDECAVKFMFDPAVPIWRGAVVYQPSHAWPGLQVADMLAVASRESTFLLSGCGMASFFSPSIMFASEFARRSPKRRFSPSVPEAWTRPAKSERIGAALAHRGRSGPKAV